MEEITKMSALDLAKIIKARQISVKEVLDQQMEKIKDREGDYNSYITVMEEEAYSQAKMVQKRIDDGQLDDSPLAGVPMAVKDDISTKGIRTSAASRILSNYKPTYDASVVEKLKDAGSIIIGKTNMAEFNISGSSESSFMVLVKTHGI